MFNMVPDPAADQTQKEITAFLRSVQIGDEVALRCTMMGITHYQILRVDGLNPRAGRLYTKWSRYTFGGIAWYTKSGKNCFAPTGQARLCIPTTAVHQFANDHPDGARVKHIPAE